MTPEERWSGHTLQRRADEAHYVMRELQRRVGLYAEIVAAVAALDELDACDIHGACLFCGAQRASTPDRRKSDHDACAWMRARVIGHQP